MIKLPSSVLFACNTNTIRSPMAEAILKHLMADRVYVDSVGLRRGELDGFAIAAMEEIGIDISGHEPKSFDDLEDCFFDLVISLTPESQHRAVEMTRAMACEVEFWPTMDPTVVEGSREVRLDAYRQVRDVLFQRIKARLGLAPAPKA